MEKVVFSKNTKFKTKTGRSPKQVGGDSTVYGPKQRNVLSRKITATVSFVLNP